MNACDEILDLISARLDGPLTDWENQILAEHLTSCPQCKALADDLQEIHAVMPGLNAPAPAFIMENVMERIKAEESKVVAFPGRKSYRRQWRALGATAAVFAVVLAGTFALRGGSMKANSGGNASMLDALPSTAPSAAVAEPRDVPAAGEGEETLTAPTAEDILEQGIVTERGLESSDEKGVAATAGEADPTQDPVTFASRPYSLSVGEQTPETACQTLFELLKTQNYPSFESTAPWDGAALTGSAEDGNLVYTLAPATREGETYTWELVYMGLSANHKYYEFHLCASVTGNKTARAVQGGWYGVAVADGTILTAQDDLKAYEKAVNDE